MSKILEICERDLQKVLDDSASLSEVLRKINGRSGTGAFRTLKNRIIKENLSTEKLDNNRKIKRSPSWKVRSDEEFFVSGRLGGNSAVKSRALASGLLEEVCSECGLSDIWNGKKLILQMDHINGVNNDFRIENLRMLCPNCHTQTATFSGKHLRKKKVYTCSCGAPKVKQAKKCWECNALSMRRAERPSNESLLEEIALSTKSAVAIKYGVTHTTINRWLKHGVV